MAHKHCWTTFLQHVEYIPFSHPMQSASSRYGTAGVRKCEVCDRVEITMPYSNDWYFVDELCNGEIPEAAGALQDE